MTKPHELIWIFLSIQWPRYFVLSALTLGNLNASTVPLMEIWGDCPCLFYINACVACGGWVPSNLGAGAADPKPR